MFYNVFNFSSGIISDVLRLLLLKGVFSMGDVTRKAMEERRQEIIDRLIVLDVYKKDDKHLFELTLTELDQAYKEVEKNSHPHGNLRSIKWSGRKKHAHNGTNLDEKW